MIIYLAPFNSRKAVIRNGFLIYLFGGYGVLKYDGVGHFQKTRNNLSLNETLIIL